MKDYQSFIKDLEKLISYKSTLGTPEKNAPFGKEVADALSFFLSRAEEMGFQTINYDNYIGEVIFGDGEEIGIIGHLDVVPTGIGWNTDPFTLTKIDGVYFGRGIQDDKAPLLSCLYALKEIKDSGVSPKRKFRLIVGCDEESGWQDVEYLSKKTAIPEYGFSPDGNFPLSYAEKGITIVKIKLPKLKNFHSLIGGTAVNAVCDYARITARADGINPSLLSKHGLKISPDGVIESFGKSAHGSTPSLGKNALKPLFSYLLDMGEDLSAVLDLFNDKMNLSTLKTDQGVVTLSPDLIETDGENTYLLCDCRIPAPLSASSVLRLLDGLNLTYSATEKHPPFMVEKDGFLVQTLINAYNEVTGENASPISMGGSTFARAFKKGCAFGPEFSGHDAKIHDANENLPEELLLKYYDIYLSALLSFATK